MKKNQGGKGKTPRKKTRWFKTRVEAKCIKISSVGRNVSNG